MGKNVIKFTGQSVVLSLNFYRLEKGNNVMLILGYCTRKTE